MPYYVVLETTLRYMNHYVFKFPFLTQRYNLSLKDFQITCFLICFYIDFLLD